MMKGELEELGEEVDPAVDSISKVQTQILNLTSGTSKPVNIFDDNGEFRDYYDIMRDIASIVDELQSTDRAQLYEILFGKNRMNQGAAMIQAFKSGQIDEALNAALDSDGSALAEQEKWSQSLEASLGRLEASWQSLSKTLMDSDFLKGLIDGLSDFVNLLDTVIDEFGVLPTLITGVFGAMSFTKFKPFEFVKDESSKLKFKIQGDLIEAFKGFKNKENISFAFDTKFANDLKLDIQSLNAFKEAVGGGMTTVDALSKCMQNASQEAILYASNTDIANLSVKDFAKKQKQTQISLQAQDKSFKNCKSLIAGYNEALKSADGSHTDFVSGIGQSNSAMGNYLKNLNGAKASFGGYIKHLVGAKAATIGLQVATTALNMAMTMGLSLAIQGLIEGLSYVINYSDEVAKKAKEDADEAREAAEAYREEYDSITELIQKYKELAESDTQDATTRSEILSVQNEITKLVGTQAENLDLVNGKLDDQLTKLYEIRNVDDMISTYRNAYETAKTASKDYSHKDGHWLTDGAYDKDTITIDYFGDNKGRDKALDIIDKAWKEKGYGQAYADITDYGIYWDTYSVLDFEDGMDMSQKVEALNTAIESLEKAKGFDYLNSELWSKLVEVRDSITGENGVLSGQIEAANNLLDVLAENAVNNNKSNVDSLDDYILYRQEVVDTILNDESIQSAINDGVLSKDGVITYIDGYLGSLEKFETQYNEWYQKIGSDTAKGINDIKAKFASKDLFTNPFDNKDGFNKSMQFNDWIDSLSQDEKEIVYNISLDTDTAEYTLKDWQNALANYQVPEELKISFTDLMGDEDFTEQVDAHIEQINTLQEAYKSFNDGEFTKSDFIELAKQFPELADNADDLDVAIEDLISKLTGGEDAFGNFTGIYKTFNDQFGRMKTDEDRKALKNFQDAVLELGKVVGDTQFSIDISAESEGMESLFAAMKESVSSTGLTAESISKLKARYKDLDNYNAAELFERTTNGIHLNTKALRELEAEYKKTKKASIDNELQELVDKYNELTKQIENTTDATAKGELYAQRSEINDQINDVADLAAQYEGLTSAFHLWEQAQSNGDERDMYASIYKGKEEIDEEMSRGWFDKGTKTYIDLLSFKDLSTATFDEIVEEYKRLNQEIESTGFSAFDFFTVDEDGKETSEGVFNFFDAVIAKNEELQEKTGKANPFAWTENVDGIEKYHFDFGVGGDEAVAETLGISEELVQIILRASEDAGFEVHLDSAYTSLELLETETEKAVETVNKALSKMGEEEVSFNFNATDVGNVENQIKEAQRVLDLFKNTDGTVNLATEGAEEAQQILVTLIAQKQQLNTPSVMSVDTTQAKGDIGEVITLLQDYQTNYNNLQIETAIGADTTEAQTNIQNILTKLDTVPAEIKTKLGLDEEAFQTAVSTLKANVNAGVTLDQASLDTVTATIGLITPEMMVKAGLDSTLIDGYDPEDKEAIVEYEVVDTEVIKYEAPLKNGVVEYDVSESSKARINDWTVPTLYGNVIYTPKSSKSATSSDSNGIHVNGTAHVGGTAYARGNWGTKKTETALTGELGRELIVYGDRYWTVGDNGAEFTTIPRGAIVFNHKQTEELLSNGYVTSNGGRGKAYANGTFSSEGKAFSRGGGVGRVSVSGSVTTTTTTTGETSTKDSGSNKEAEKEFKETFDWIEIAIDRIERAISKLDLKVNSTYKTWSNRNTNLSAEISKVEEEIDLQEKAYQRYLKEANSVGLSSSWAKKVREGKVDIETITDEELAEKIKNYQTWYEKAIDCKDAVEELKETEASLYETAFQNVVTQYENILSIAEHEKNMLDSYISQAETKGHIVSGKYYEALIDNEEYNLEKLREEKSKLVSSLENAVNSGYIKKYSEAWYGMVNQIDEVTLSIEESNEAILEYNNSIREIEWSIFDLLQEKISGITKESEFLIDLMSNDKLYDDRGQLTDEGLSTMGLHGVNYNTYLAQAEKYAEEMLKIEKEIANDPYDQELVNRKQELLELQQEMILASENEKQAIVDMVSEGIELELDSLSELIDKYEEALDSQKD